MIVVIMARSVSQTAFDLEKLAISISFQTDIRLSRLTDQAIETKREFNYELFVANGPGCISY